jgi:hypothetical protein
MNVVSLHSRHPGRTGWGFSGKLGVGAKQAVKAQAERFEYPAMRTVQVSLDTSALAASTVFLGRLVVDFGLDVGTTQRSIDVAAGASISGLADKILALVVDESPENTGEVVGVQITCTDYPRPTGVTPVRTGFSGAIAAAATQNVPVPNGASGLIVMGSQFAGLQVTQYACLATLGGPPAVVVSESDAIIGQAQPLVQGCRFVGLTNGSGSPTNATLCWVIDG